MKQPFAYIIAFVFVVLVAGGVLAGYINRVVEPSGVPTLVPQPTKTARPSILPTTSVTASPSPSPAPEVTPVVSLPASVSIDVPFTSQAPYGNWDAIHEDTCEEAAMLMAQWFAQGKKGVKSGANTNLIPNDEAEKSLQAIIAWENANLGKSKDTNASETVRFGEGYLGLKNLKQLVNLSADDMKRELARGNILVAPTAGKLLGNRYFTPPGPPYHMIVIKGYNANGFITNDPGTRHGEGYVYSDSVLMNAIHDWTGSYDTIESGKNVVIVVSPNAS